MLNLNTQTIARGAGSFIERVSDRIGMLFLLALSLSTAGAIVVGL